MLVWGMSDLDHGYILHVALLLLRDKMASWILTKKPNRTVLKAVRCLVLATKLRVSPDRTAPLHIGHATITW